MSDANAVLLIPLEITADMIKTGTSVPVVDSGAGEVAWAIGTAYVVDDKVNHEGSIWSAVADNTGVEPGTDNTKWIRFGPSNRMAPFDDQLDTVTRANGEITYVLQSGFFTGIGLWGMYGEQLTITIYDEPGGVIVEQHTVELFAQALGLYELLFMPLARRTQFYLENLPLYPDAELHISITSAGSGLCEVALITVGHWDTLIGTGTWGGVEYGAKAEVKSYSYLRRNDDGSVTRKRRGSADNGVYSVVLPADQANHAMELLRKVQGRPVAYIANGHPQYEYLNGFGDVSGSIVPEGPNHARMSLKLEGAVQRIRS